MGGIFGTCSPVPRGEKMDRFVKRSMEVYGMQFPRAGKIQTAIDSASQSNFVTVRQMFSDDPAFKPQAGFNTSAVIPFLINGYLTLSISTDEHRASISKRFNFYVY